MIEHRVDLLTGCFLRGHLELFKNTQTGRGDKLKVEFFMLRICCCTITPHDNASHTAN